MTVKPKRFIAPLISASVGLVNFIFMFLSYAAVFAIGGDEFEIGERFSAYGAMDFGEESLANGFDILLSAAGRDTNASFMLKFLSIALIAMAVLSAAMLIFGGIGLVREFAGVNLLGTSTSKIANKTSKIFLQIYFILAIVSSGLLLTSCLLNLYVDSVFGYTFAIGLIPDFGMTSLLALAIASKIVLAKLEKKFAAAPATVSAPTQCPTCGAELEEGAQFCAACGAAIVAPTAAETVEAEADEEDDAKNVDYAAIAGSVKALGNKGKEYAKEKNISLKSIILAAVALVVVIVAIVAVLNIKPATYIIPDDNISYVYSESEEQTFILSNGKKTDIKMDGRVSSAATSLDGKTKAFLSSDATLYVYTGKKLQKVAEDVSDYKMSAEGTALAYIGEDDELVLYTVKNGEKKTVSDDSSAYHLSPDGKSIAYAEGPLDDCVLYVMTGDKKEKIKKDSIPLGLSDGGKLVYYRETDTDTGKTTVFVRKGDEDVKLLTSGATLIYNADHTQALFYSDSDNWYISNNGGEKQKLSSKGIGQFGDFSSFGETISTTLPVKDFKEQYFVDDSGNLYYINKKLEAQEVADDVVSFKTDKSNSVIYYLTDDDELYRGKGYGKKFKMIADDVESYAISSNGKKCYFIDEADTLRYVKSAKKDKKIADDVRNMHMTHDDYLLFLADYASGSGTLYSSHNGSKKKLVADDVVKFTVNANSAYYYVESDDAYDVFGTAKKAKFKAVAEEVE